jgi:DNA-directed RNA polymerase specialized sigma24 family protein
VAEKEDRSHPLPGLADWEHKLASVIAKKFERIEPEELEAELFQTVIELKARLSPEIQNWEGYLAKALHNKAHNWTRDRRAAAKREFALPEPDKETRPFFTSNEDNIEHKLAMAHFWQHLQPELKQLWELLEQENWNQTRVAHRLGKHRNTVRSWIRRIYQIFIAHGFQPDSDKLVVRRVTRPDEFVVLSSRLLRVVAGIRLSGTAWRILLWLICETSKRKQTTTPFSWYQFAKELSLDRGNVWRAGRGLITAGLVSIQEGRIGLRRNVGRSRQRRNEAPADDSRR